MYEYRALKADINYKVFLHYKKVIYGHVKSSLWNSTRTRKKPFQKEVKATFATSNVRVELTAIISRLIPC